MSRNTLATLPVLGVLGLAAIAGDPFDLSWNTIDGGGIMRSSSEDDQFTLSGTIGQHDAGAMAGGSFRLTGGFWFETPPGDCNSNGILDLLDHGGFVDCLTGPAFKAAGDCRCFETSGNGAVDLLDFAKAQREFFGH